MIHTKTALVFCAARGKYMVSISDQKHVRLWTKFIQLLNSLHSSRLLKSQTPERDVWINERLIPSSEVTTQKPASDFDRLIV